jgi:ABC-2 type transport system permease protein
MSTPQNGVHEFPVDSQRIATPVTRENRPMLWSIRRELWEHRYLYIAPVAIAAFVLFASAISTAVSLPRVMRGLSTMDVAKQHNALVQHLSMPPAAIMLTGFLIAWFYCLDALYGERRDRSILFWKSLPVSDRTTVLSKASIPFLVLPALTFALSAAAQMILFFESNAVILATGHSPAALWARFSIFEGWVLMAYGLSVHVLWFAPIYCWFLLISAWAKRAPFLWAVLPFLAIAAVEKMLFGTLHLMYMLQYRMTGAMLEAFGRSDGKIHRFSDLAPLKYLSTPGLWVGLIFAAVCLAVAVRVRRNREPI